MILRVSKLGFALALVSVFVNSAASAQTQTTPAPAAQKADDAQLPVAQTIIDRHIEAVGGAAAIKARNSLNVKGSIAIPAQGITGTMEVFAARPNKVVTKTTLLGIGDISDGYDGTVAWTMSPMTGPMLSTGDELAQKAFDANFDGALGIAAKYESIKTLEKTTFEGRPAYKIALTRKGGGDDIEFYDVDTGLKAGSVTERKNPMGTISVTSTVTDYKKFGDLLQPTVLKQSMTGVQVTIMFTSYEYDKVDPSVFDLPPSIKALVK